MRKWLIGFLVLGVFWGCAPKEELFGEQQGLLPSEPTEEMAESSGMPLERLQMGREIYLKDCGKCHEAMMPDDISQEDWHLIVGGMAWNAGISAEDEEAVMDYILAVLTQ